MDEIIDAFVNWYEDIECRMNEDMDIACFTGRIRNEARHELDAIVRYSRDYIRIDQGDVEDTRSNVNPNPPVVNEEPSDSVPPEEQDDDDDNYQNMPHLYCDTAEAEDKSCYDSHLFLFLLFSEFTWSQKIIVPMCGRLTSPFCVSTCKNLNLCSYATSLSYLVSAIQTILPA